MIMTCLHPDSSSPSTGAIVDLWCTVLREIVSGQQDDGAGLLIDDRRRIAERVRAVIANDLRRTPGLTTVGTATKNHVDVLVISPSVPPSFDKDEQCTVDGDYGRDPEL